MRRGYFRSCVDKDTGRLDVAFNNAGIVGSAHRIEDYPSAEFDNVLRVNLRSIFLCIKYEIPTMKRTGGVREDVSTKVSLLSTDDHKGFRCYSNKTGGAQRSFGVSRC